MATYVREPEGVGVSPAGTLGGTLAAIGMLALIAGIITAIGAALGVDVDFTRTEWRAIGWGGVATLAAALFVSFLFGGYIAGRMALSAGAPNGMFVFMAGLLIFAVAWLLTWALVGTSTIADGLQDADIPTDRSLWTDIGIGAVIAGGVAMLLGALLGGVAGARWQPPLAVTESEEYVDLRESRAAPPDTTDRDLSVEEEREFERQGRR